MTNPATSSIAWSDSTQSLARLVASAQHGSRDAFDELVRRTYRDTYTLALRLLSDPEDARDVTQEAYLRAFRGLEHFRGDASFGTWMYRITANCSATHLRKRFRHRHEALSEDIDLVDETPSHNPAANSEAESLRAELVAAVGALPPKLRAVIVLRDIYDLAHDEIARELAISESAAKVRLHRARRRLRDDFFARRSDTLGGHRAL